MKILIAILLLVPGAIVKAVLAVLGFFVVSLTFHIDKVPKMFRADANRPQTWWEMAVRNPANGTKFWVKHPNRGEVKTYGKVREANDTSVTTFVTFSTTESKVVPVPYLQARVRHWKHLISFRTQWIYPGRRRYGEIYIGWKLLSESPALGFALQFRWMAKVGN